MKNISQSVIAKQLGCSVSTVSRALNNQSRISESVRQKVMFCAQNLGYSGSRQSKVVALVLYKPDHLIDVYSHALQNEIAIELQKRNLKLMVVYYNDLEILTDRWICGIISLLAYGKIASNWPLTHNQPLICINDYNSAINQVPSVISNEEEAVERIFELLQTKKCKNVALLTLFDHTLSTEKRVGFAVRCAGRLNMQLEKIACDDILRVKPGKIMLQLSDKYDAVICCGELFRAFPLNLPEEFYLSKVIVHWELPGCQLKADEHIFSLAQNYPAIAVAAVDILIKKLNGQGWSENLISYNFSW